jgi:light-regulated signal transduction histidine kinase (bacteriophytochrome)
MAASPAEDARFSLDDGVRELGQNCEDEPIRIPGSIQRHGFLLLLDDRDERVVAASQNAEDFLEVPLGLVLGTPIETILEREVLGALRALTNSTDDEGLLTYLGSFQMREDSSVS